MSPAYPLALDLAGRAVLCVGGGAVTERRIAGFIAAEARVRVVAPTVTDTIKRLAESGDVGWDAREFAVTDLGDVWLVHVATDDPSVDRTVTELAQARRIFCVSAGDHLQGSATTMARSLLPDGTQLAVSSGGDFRQSQRWKRFVDTVTSICAGGNLAPGPASAGRGTVTLVGAGPGDPELLTIKGARALAEADVVVTDRLVPASILATVSQVAVVIPMGKAPGRHAAHQDDINATLVREAQNGARVVRLKGGDPFVLGRGGEEVLACLEAGVPVHIVPGISSALAGPAAAGIPVTHRGLSSSVVIASAHDDSPTLRRLLAQSQGSTVVLLMGAGRSQALTQAMIDSGWPNTTAAATITSAWTVDQHTRCGTLEDFATGHVTPQAPAICVIGDVAQLGRSLDSLVSVSPLARHDDPS